jgi:hypothetical protein
VLQDINEFSSNWDEFSNSAHASVGKTSSSSVIFELPVVRPLADILPMTALWDPLPTQPQMGKSMFSLRGIVHRSAA